VLIFFFSAIFLTALACWGAVRVSRVAAIGCAYKAKVLASALFVSRRGPESKPFDDVSSESYWIMRLFSEIGRAHV
jgi:hypothetical protein